MHFYGIAPLSPARQPVYTYASDVALDIGQVVEVMFGRRRELGVVWTEAAPMASAKSILTAYAVTLPRPQRDLAVWIAEEYLAPLGTVLRSFVPEGVAKLTVPSVSDSRGSSSEVTVTTAVQRQKTYLAAIEAARKAGRSALVLIPEVAAASSPSIPDLPDAMLYHSRLTPKRRREIWQQVAIGVPLTLLGTRSALLLPWYDLGVIVVDEEDDLSYKQEQAPRWHARGVAAKLARLNGAELIYGSATPSLETFRLVGSTASAEKPARDFMVRTTDPSRRQPHEAFDYESWQVADDALKAGHRVVVYAPQRLHSGLTSELARSFPTTRAAYLNPASQSAREVSRVLHEFQRGQADVLYGGQALSRWWDYRADVIVCLGVDGLLQAADFRASEKTHALLRKLTTKLREGGTLLIQSNVPDHDVFRSLKKPFETWARPELAERQALKLPPYVRLTRAIWRGSEEEAAPAARELATKLQDMNIEATASPCATWREQEACWHVLIKGDPKRLAGLIPQQATVDVDPLDLL